MKSMFLKISALTAALTLSVFAHAQPRPSNSPTPKRAPAAATSNPISYYNAGYNHELQIGIGQGGLTTSKSGKDTLTVIQLHMSYARPMINDRMQLGGEGGFYSTSGGARTQSYFEAFGFGNYNLTADHRNSIYGKLGLGLFAVINDKGDYESKFGFMIGGGKRFALWDHVSYNPEMRLFKKGDQDPTFEIQIVNVSIMF